MRNYLYQIFYGHVYRELRRQGSNSVFSLDRFVGYQVLPSTTELFVFFIFRTGSHYLDEAGLELTKIHPPVSASQGLGLKACATGPT